MDSQLVGGTMDKSSIWRSVATRYMVIWRLTRARQIALFRRLINGFEVDFVFLVVDL